MRPTTKRRPRSRSSRTTFPDEIKADVQTLADWYATYTAKLKDIGITAGQTPTAAQLQQLQTAISSDTSEVQAASQRLEAWSQENCTG